MASTGMLLRQVQPSEPLLKVSQLSTWITSLHPTKARNWDKSVACFCHQGAVWSQTCFVTFIQVKNHKITKTSITKNAREKVSADFEYSKFYNILYAGLAKFENNTILLNKISNSQDNYWVKDPHYFHGGNNEWCLPCIDGATPSPAQSCENST